MKLASIQHRNRERVAVAVDEETLVDVNDLLHRGFVSLLRAVRSERESG
jgi:hypothetical protein